jgi:sulfur-carrier protein
MRLEVVVYPPYRAGLGAGTLELDVPDGSTLRDVLRVLAQRSQEFQPLAGAARDEWLWGQLLVHVRGEMVRLNEALHDGDCLELLPPIAGGS